MGVGIGSALRVAAENDDGGYVLGQMLARLLIIAVVVTLLVWGVYTWRRSRDTDRVRRGIVDEERARQARYAAWHAQQTALAQHDEAHRQALQAAQQTAQLAQPPAVPPAAPPPPPPA